MTDSSARGECKVIEFGEQCRKKARSQPVHKSFRKNARKANIRFAPGEPTYICDLHFEMVDRAMKSKQAFLSKKDTPIPKVDFSKLPVSSLRKYIQKNKIPNPKTTDALIQAVETHFTTQRVSELESILKFANAVHKDTKTSSRT
eukprot:gene9515-10398_t